MENKPAVTILQEHCARNKIEQPKYDYISGEDGGFICKVQLLDLEAYGNGRSKRDAKHLSAVNILRKIQRIAGLNTEFLYPSSSLQSDEDVINHNRDMLKELRDYCVRKDIPLPTIEIVQRSGTPNAPEFVACCTIATIQRYGKSDKKKDARQRAAIEMLYVISKGDETDPVNMQVATEGSNASAVDEIESQRRLKFKTYREMTEANVVEDRSIKICDRHNYFKSYYPELRQKAFVAMKSEEYETTYERVMAVLEALKLTPRITTLPTERLEPLVQIELNCDYEFVLIAHESKVYDDLLEYFRDMIY